MKVWKFQLNAQNKEVEMPNGSRIISVQAQDNFPCIWAEVHPNQRLVKRRFLLVPTGDNVPNQGVHIGSCMFNEGALMLHVYEITR